MPTQEQRLVELIKSDQRITELLRAVRSLDVDQWCIAAGTIRNKVWDHLHGFTEPTLPSDIDVLVYDPHRAEARYEAALETELQHLVPGVQWEVVNQATVHTYVGDPGPFESTNDAMSRWADLATAVGVHLTVDDQVVVTAPAGLNDLFNLRVRPNLVTPTSRGVYQDRMDSKGWKEIWPLLTIEDVAD